MTSARPLPKLAGAFLGVRFVYERQTFAFLPHSPKGSYRRKMTFGWRAPLINASKSWLVVKEPSHTSAFAIFQDTGIKITTEGRPLLGAPIGTDQYTSDFISQKVDD